MFYSYLTKETFAYDLSEKKSVSFVLHMANTSVGAN